MNRTLNIAVDARPLATPPGGIRRYLENLIREIALQGSPHNFFLYTDLPFQCDFTLPQHWKIRHSKHRPKGLSTAIAQILFPLWARIDNIDVFWSPRHQLPLLLPRKVRKVLTIHDLVWKRFPGTMRRGGPIVESVLTPCSIRIADHIIAVSHFTKSELVGLFPVAEKKVSVVYEASTLKTGNSTAQRRFSSDYFIFVGSNEPRKNMRGLLTGYRRYLDLAPGAIDLVIAGSDQWGEFDLREFIRSNGLESRIHVLSKVSDADLRDLYADATACVLVSFYEGFGLPLVEAMQCGVPLIVSHNSALAEIADNAAILVDPNDTEEIARALERMSEDTELRSRLAHSAEVRGRAFSWRTAAMETLPLITTTDLAGTTRL